MRVPKVFISEKDLSDKIKEMLKKISKDDNSKYEFRFELKANKNNKDFLITYSVPKTRPESETVQLKIENTGSGEEDFDELVDLANNLCSHHQYSIILIGKQKKKEKVMNVCTAYSKTKIPYEDLMTSIISFYTENVDDFKIIKALINKKSYRNDEVFSYYAP